MKKKSLYFQERILVWYDKNQRNLPWRKNKNPYSIWLSEVILQQTRVAQGLSYYEKFIETFPTVGDLAKAEEDKVLKLWQGLGYYSRARNLQSAAKQIVENYQGKFPNKSEELKKLKGVGNYTAAAIASIAFNEAVAVIDGNVYRVLSRFLGISAPIDSSSGKKIFEDAAGELLWKKDPGKYNQAIMEFGAKQCVPKNPDCRNCPLCEQCDAYHSQRVKELPVKKKSVTQKIRHFNFLVLNCKGKIGVQKRTEKDIWQGLYQFPLIESPKGIESFEELLSSSGLLKYSKSLIYRKKREQKTHLLTHQQIIPVFWETEWQGNLREVKQIFEDTLFVSRSLAEDYPFPKIIEKYWKTLVD